MNVLPRVFVLATLSVVTGSSFDARAVTEPGEHVLVQHVLNGRTYTLALEPYDLRSAAFRVRVADAEGDLREVAAPPPATWRGFALEAPHIAVAATRGASGWNVAMLDTRRGWPGAISERDVANVVSPRSRGLTLAGCTKVCEIAFDADFEFYLANGASVDATVADIETILNAVELIYARDVRTTYTLTEIIVRTAEPDPYTSTDAAVLLQQFRQHWNSDQADVPRDVAHQMTRKDLSGGLVGAALIGVVCDVPSAYGLSSRYTSDFDARVALTARELGSNWNAPACDFDDSLMCGGDLVFDDEEILAILDFQEGLSCLDDGPPYSTPVPPRALDDAAVTAGVIVIDVLANDLDGNCDALEITEFDSTSAEGGTVERSVGSGPGGRDELRYVPRSGFVGMDTFGYVTGDGTAEDEAVVSIEVTERACPDVDGDGDTDLQDLSILLAHYGGAGGPDEGDLTGDGLVDLDDLSLLLGAFGCA